jgi:pyridoxamine 5'-phosphate oxidase
MASGAAAAILEMREMQDSALSDPFALFESWYEEARTAERDPTAMALATATAEGVPSVRMVLLKGADRRGFVFYTNLESRKSLELAANPKASLCLWWQTIRRQVRIEGTVEPVSEAEADAYFASRHYGSQIGAWASLQSRPLESRAALERRVTEYEAQYPQKVPRPPSWSGFRVVPQAIEFWRELPDRLHERLLFEPDGAGWSVTRLYP